MCKEKYINIQTGEELNLDKVNELKGNAMLKVNPHLFEIWDFEKNNELGLDIYKVTKSPKGKAWWYCPTCKDSYPQAIGHKNNGTGCSICTGKYVTKVNCIATTNPYIAQLMLNKEDSYKYTKSSEFRVDWKCDQCGNIIKNKKITNINNNGLSCPICSDGVKFPEKVMNNVLKQLNIEYNYDMTTHFSKDKRYDFYLPDYNMIIETHGGQHYNGGFRTLQDSRSLEEEQNNDNYKYELAISNGIKYYIVIDCRFSDLQWIKNNILDSELNKIFDLSTIDWDKVLFNSSKSNKIECLNMYLEGRRDYQEMANELKVNYATVMKWLNFWNDEGKCQYSPLDTRKEIVQLDMNNNFIKIWESLWEVRKHYKNAYKVLKNERSNDKGYRFMYKEDYDKYILDNKSYSFYVNKKITRQIVQLSTNDEFIREWDSISEAARFYGKNNPSGIVGVCNNRKITSIGFKWMYKEDYNKLIKNK